MTPTRVKSGTSVSVGTTEIAIDISGPLSKSPGEITLELISGSYQYKTAFVNDPPVITSTQTILSTAGDKKIVTIEPGREHLRLLSPSAAVVHVSY